MPAPSSVSAHAAHAVKTLEDVGLFLHRDAYVRVGDGQLHVLLHRGQPHRDAALEGVLQGIGQQVGVDLLPHLAVRRHGRGQRRGGQSLQPASEPVGNCWLSWNLSSLRLRNLKTGVEQEFYTWELLLPELHKSTKALRLYIDGAASFNNAGENFSM
jgi:hypothetical protein